MSVFTADDDKSLILLVVMFESASGEIDWNPILHHLSPTTKTIQELQERLIYLKEIDRRVLNALPADFLAGTSLERPRTNDEIYEAIEEIFYSISQADVRQPSGLRHLNAGEMAPIGITFLIEAINLQANDVFVDIGSGTGSLLAQIVLQSQVNRAIGIEIREDLAQKSRQSLQNASAKYPSLRKIEIFNDDVKDLKWQTMFQLSCATVIFCNNIVFEPGDNITLLRVISSFGKREELRIVLVSQRFCARCHASCSNEFCTIWEEVQIVSARTTWSNKLLPLYIYKRRVTETKKARGYNLLDMLNDM